ncbi:MAG: site-specific integrase [Bacteroidales bacterium]|nr:site-specific integrase [Bacteroidales bacterium]
MIKKKITLRRIFHHDVWRYTIDFDYNSELISLLKGINGATFSGSLKCWHVPCDETTLKKVLTVFRGTADIDISHIALPSERNNVFSPVLSDSQNLTDHDNDNQGLSVLPPPVVIRKKAASFEYIGRFGAVRFSINETDGRLAIKFLGKYNPVWIEEMKSYGPVYYDKKNKEWLLPWSQMTVDSLSDYFITQGIKVNVVKISIPDVVKELRVDHGSEIRNNVLGSEAYKGIEMVRCYLDEKRYSRHTVEAYISHLQLFFKYFSNKTPGNISEDDISAFLHDHITTNNYSASYQNQFISAVKIFYGLYGRSHISIDSLGRPRRSRTLPKVFSKEEVIKILNSSTNTKHKLILWMIYSCGLRRSEVTNIRLKDLDRERSILDIREGKGMVDRIVPISPKVWEKIDSYINSYKPVIWLFEGQAGGKYSVESVYRVFKEALRKSGIKKDVGVHSLRHSYATHLHESGLDIRYIQELLGHKSTRTTEIYTHVSRRNLIAIRSPIEDLDVK